MKANNGEAELNDHMRFQKCLFAAYDIYKSAKYTRLHKPKMDMSHRARGLSQRVNISRFL